MAEIKNNTGQVFANFDEWKKWAEAPSEKWTDRQNILPELVEFLTFYPWIIERKKQGAEQAENFSNAVRELFPDAKDSTLLREALQNAGDKLGEFGYLWIDDCYNLFNMTLSANDDGTYSLVRLNALRGDTLIIPECVSSIELTALQGHSLRRAIFPENYASNAPLYIDFLSITTAHPLNIKCDEEILNNLYNERFFNLKYRTFVSLYELYPQAFAKSENGKCMFDEGEFSKNLNMMKNVSEDGTFVQVKAGNELDEVFELDGCTNIIAMELLGKKSYREGEIKTRVIPATVDTLFVDTPLDELIIEGNPHNVFLYQKPKRLKINAPLPKVNASNIARDYKESYGEQHDNYIFNVPDLCEDDSILPGYIKATLAFRDGVEAYDVITEINTKFIVSMSPDEIAHRDHPVMGTRIHMASNGIERHQTLVVYESMEMIAEKIAKVTIQK